MNTRKDRLSAAVLAITSNICFGAKNSFAIQKWGLRGYTFHGLVFLMVRTHHTRETRLEQTLEPEPVSAGNNTGGTPLIFG